MTGAVPARASSTRGTLQALGLVVFFCLLGIVLSGGYVVTGAGAGLAAFLVYRIVGVRMLLCRHHRQGIGLSMDDRLPEALDAFAQSEADWSRRAWLDRHRGWLLGITSPWPFHALALYNQGYCLARLGRGPEAVAVLDALLARYPAMAPALELRGSLVDRGEAGQAGDWGDLLGSSEPGGDGSQR